MVKKFREMDVPIDDIQGASVSIVIEIPFCYNCYWSPEELLDKCIEDDINE